MKVILLSCFFLFSVVYADYKLLRCLVCRATVEEMTKQIDTVNPKKKIQVGGYRLDNTGKVEEKLVPYARSSMHLSELMETICEKFQDYVRATDKTTGKLLLMKLLTDDGSMNPRMSEVDIIQDSDLNKSLGFYCEGIVEEFEDEIYDVLKEPSLDPVNNVCTKATQCLLQNDRSITDGDASTFIYLNLNAEQYLTVRNK